MIVLLEVFYMSHETSGMNIMKCVATRLETLFSVYFLGCLGEIITGMIFGDSERRGMFLLELGKTYLAFHFVFSGERRTKVFSYINWHSINPKLHFGYASSISQELL
jgi:hypothetical protein